MIGSIERRTFLASTTAGITGMVAVGVSPSSAAPVTGDPLGLGLVTYNLAKDWDVETIIKNCAETGFGAVELRTTHAHGVEVTLSASERREIAKRFADSPVVLASLGSAFEYDAPDPAVLKKNIEGAKEYAELARDVGASGIKVRPNRLHTEDGVPEEKTLEQIGTALREVSAFAADYGIEIRVEVHGRDTCRLPRIRKIMDYAAHDNCRVCWNSNQEDLLDGGLEANFDLVKDKISFVHMRDLYNEDYPHRRLFQLLHGIGYESWCCAEIPGSDDPIRVMRYYRALFLALQDAFQGA